MLLLVAFGCAQTTVQPYGHFQVYFNNDRLTGGETVCDAVFPLARTSPPGIEPEVAALKALFAGPTVEEQSRGYRSFFSPRTADLLLRIKLEDATAYVDLHDRRRELSGVSSSCGSAEFLTQIQRTLEELPHIDRVVFAIEGDPRLFYDWLELECDASNDHCDAAPFRD